MLVTKERLNARQPENAHECQLHSTRSTNSPLPLERKPTLFEIFLLYLTSCCLGLAELTETKSCVVVRSSSSVSISILLWWCHSFLPLHRRHDVHSRARSLCLRQNQSRQHLCRIRRLDSDCARAWRKRGSVQLPVGGEDNTFHSVKLV